MKFFCRMQYTTQKIAFLFWFVVSVKLQTRLAGLTWSLFVEFIQGAIPWTGPRILREKFQNQDPLRNCEKREQKIVAFVTKPVETPDCDRWEWETEVSRGIHRGLLSRVFQHCWFKVKVRAKIVFKMRDRWPVRTDTKRCSALSLPRDPDISVSLDCSL